MKIQYFNEALLGSISGAAAGYFLGKKIGFSPILLAGIGVLVGAFMQHKLLDKKSNNDGVSSGPRTLVYPTNK
jgi:outer membrane lipoprotein SlyB